MVSRAVLPFFAFLGIHGAWGQRKVTQVQMCFAPYTLDTTGPVAGTTITGYPCDANCLAVTSAPPAGLFSFITTPPICTARMIGNQPGSYEAFVTAMVTFGNTRVAYDFTRTTFIRGTGPCMFDNGTATGTCTCELEPEVNVITGTTGKIKEKMIKDIQYDFAVNPMTQQRSGAILTLTYNRKGPALESL